MLENQKSFIICQKCSKNKKYNKKHKKMPNKMLDLDSVMYVINFKLR